MRKRWRVAVYRRAEGVDDAEFLLTQRDFVFWRSALHRVRFVQHVMGDWVRVDAWRIGSR